MFLANLQADPIVKLLNAEWLASINVFSILIRLVLALLIGGLCGADRAKKRHAAGLRTYILVGLGAAIAGFSNQFILEFFGSGDGARLGAQVISGIGFLCAGTIIVTSRSQIKGLTTAASLWAIGCLGLACGLGFYTLALVGGAIIIVTLAFLPKIESFFVNRSRAFTLFVELDARTYLKEIVNYLREKGFAIDNVEHNVAYASSGLSVYTLDLTYKGNGKISHEEIVNEVKSFSYVNHTEIISN